MDRTAAMDLVVREYFEICEKMVAGPVEFDLENSREYDWGWVLFVRASGPKAELTREASLSYTPFLVDREFGMIWSASLHNLTFKIERFLEHLKSKRAAGK